MAARILRENLESALRIAIRDQENRKQEGTVFVAGLREILEASRQGAEIIVRDEHPPTQPDTPGSFRQFMEKNGLGPDDVRDE